MTKVKDMTQGQITHTFCTWCSHRRFVAGYDHWGCGLEEKKLDELCPYRNALQKEEKE